MLHVSNQHARRSPLLHKVLACFTLLFFLPSVIAQTSAIAGVMAPMALYINILEGEDALNNIHDRTAREPIVQVTDENHKPVKGAVVTFSDVAGVTGAAALFGGALTYSTVTDAEGKAFGRGFQPNGIAGKHKVEVAAAVGTMIALLTIHETNVLKGGGVFGTGRGQASGLGSSAWFIAEFAGGVAAIATYLGVTHDDSVAQFNSGSSVVATSPASVPEIDPSLGLGCLAFLAGAAAVLRKR